MKIKDALGKWIDINKNTYQDYMGDTVCKLGEGVGVIKTDDMDAYQFLKTAVVGSDGTFLYFYFMMNLGANKNKQATIINGHAYTILLKNVECPITVDDNMSEGLPTFNMSMLSTDDPDAIGPTLTNSDMNYNLLASEYFGAFSYARYNDDYYFFHPEKFRWQLLKSYDDFNILISLKNRNYVKKDKNQIMDSMMIYLDNLPNRSLNRDLLLFKNNKVLNIITEEVSDFDGSQFILKSLNANWYDIESQIPKPGYYMEKVLNDLTGRNIYKTKEADRRYDDLLVYLGYILSDMQKQNGLMLFGKAQNGKSTLANLMMHIKGSGFMPSVNSLMTDGHYTSGFFNERILFFDELKPVMMNEKFVSIFNQLLGNDELSVRPMQQSPRSVKTNFTAIITINEVAKEFVTYRALLRRVKIMTSTFPVVTNLPPHINLSDELKKQESVDWLANTAIRRFISNGYRIDNLFEKDIAREIYNLNPLAKKYLKLLQAEKYIDEELNFLVDIQKFKLEQSQIDDLHLTLKYAGDLAIFDEQINIVLLYVLGLNDMSCINGGLTWR